MTRHFFIGVLVAAWVLFSNGPGLVPFGGNAAWACGERVEVQFFETDGDIFEITNKSRGPMSLASLVIRLTGSRGRLIFDSEFGGPGAAMAQPFEPLRGEVGLKAVTLVGGEGGDGAKVMRLQFSGFEPGRRFEFVIDVDDQMESSEFGRAVVSGEEIEGAGAEAELMRPDGGTSRINGRFGPDGRALLRGRVCA